MLCSNDPRLKHSALAAIIPSSPKPAAEENWAPWCQAKPRVLALHLGADGSFSTPPVEYTDVSTLQNGLSKQNSNTETLSPSSGSVYLVEGLSGEMINVLGSHFQLHRSVFMDHERLVACEGRLTGETGGLPFLPSAVAGRQHVSLKYHEPMVFSEPPQGFRRLCDTSGRHIAVTRLMGKFSDMGVSRRKCVFWGMTTAETWTCLIICDPPIRRVIVDPYSKHAAIKVDTSPCRGGYLDFVPLSDQLRVQAGPPRTSLLDDLLFYLQNHVSVYLTQGPKPIRVFVEKLIASHFLTLVEFLQANVEVVQWHLSRRKDLTAVIVSAAEELWSNFKSWGRRVADYQDDLEGIMMQLRIPRPFYWKP